MKLGILISTLFLVVACGLPSPQEKAAPTDWKLFRGDAGLIGYTSHSLPDQPTLFWSYKTDVRTVSSPIVSGGTTYWCNRRGLLYGVDLSGELVFQYDLQTSVEATPLIHDSVLYIGRIDGYMTALSLAEKDTLWNFETLGQVSSSPNLIVQGEQKRLLFGSYDNLLYCLDAATGELLNGYETGYYLNGTPALSGDYALFGGCDSWLRIVDCTQHIATDSLQLQGYIPQSPIVGKEHCFICDYSGNLYKITLDKGKIAAHELLVPAKEENGACTAIPALAGDRLFYYSSSRHLKAITTQGEELWEYLLKGDTGESSPVVCNNRILVCTKSGIIAILDAEKGTLVWEYDTGEQIVGSPAVIRNHFLVLTAKGTLFCFGKGK